MLLSYKRRCSSFDVILMARLYLYLVKSGVIDSHNPMDQDTLLVPLNK